MKRATKVTPLACACCAYRIGEARIRRAFERHGLEVTGITLYQSDALVHYTHKERLFKTEFDRIMSFIQDDLEALSIHRSKLGDQTVKISWLMPGKTRNEVWPGTGRVCGMAMGTQPALAPQGAVTNILINSAKPTEEAPVWTEY